MHYLMGFLMAANTSIANVEIIDSRDDSSKVYVIVDNCEVKMPKNKLGDYCYMLKAVSNICKLKIDLKDCDKEPM